jgi:hypothetical protein
MALITRMQAFKTTFNTMDSSLQVVFWHHPRELPVPSVLSTLFCSLPSPSSHLHCTGDQGESRQLDSMPHHQCHSELKKTFLSADVGFDASLYHPANEKFCD